MCRRVPTLTCVTSAAATCLLPREPNHTAAHAQPSEHASPEEGGRSRADPPCQGLSLPLTLDLLQTATQKRNL